HTVLHCSCETLLYRRNEFLRNITALHFVNKLQTALSKVLINRTDIHDDIRKLTATTRLLLVNFAQVNSLRDSFLIVNLRFTLITFNLELTFQTIDDDIQVELTHTGDNRLACLLISLDCKRRIFFGQFSQTVRQL